MAAIRTLKDGDNAPDFVLPSTTGEDVHLYHALEQSPVVLFFYLKAFTPLCTAEACLFGEKLSEFRKYDALVYGVSSDSIVNAQRFANQNHLSFPLLSDQSGGVRAQYGVPKAFGLLPGRSTYVIGTDKKIKSIVHAQLGAQIHVARSLQFFQGESD